MSQADTRLAAASQRVYTGATLISHNGEMVVVVKHRDWAELGNVLDAHQRPPSSRARKRGVAADISVLTTPTLPALP